MIFHSLEAARQRFGPCALSIGNFDGVHIGHQALLKQTVACASEKGLAAGVLTFDPHPAVVVAPARVPQMISTLEERLRLLEAAGAERILVLPFTEEIARLTPEEFVSGILVDNLKVKAVFVGENFRFGHQQAGTPETLQTLGRSYGFTTQLVEPVKYRNQIVSSSLIRKYLAGGNVSRAGRLLARCFSIEGPVISGHGVGSQQTVPTLNIRPAPGQLVPPGVYVTETQETSTRRRWNSITNAGYRPTFGGDELTIETFLLTPAMDAAPTRIRISFRRFVRPERQFPNPEALKEQILKDVSRARTYWRRVSRLPHSAPSLY